MSWKTFGKPGRIVIFYCHALARDGRGAAILEARYTAI
jgi:hypothetical protein